MHKAFIWHAQDWGSLLVVILILIYTFIIMIVLKEKKKHSQHMTCPLAHLIICLQIYL